VRALVALVLSAGLLLAACGSKRPTLSAKPVKPTTSLATTSTARTTCYALKNGESLDVRAIATPNLAIYAAPNAPKPARTLANPWLYNGQAGASVPLVMLVRGFPVSLGCNWLQVYLPVRPNGSTGWVRATDVLTIVNHYRLEADLSGFHVKVFRDGAQIDSILVGVARNNTPTPGGVYYTDVLIKPPDPNGAYGPFAYGLSGFSDVLTSFNGGPGQLGIHGTDQPQYLGTQVSHGCIRMSNDNITKLAQFIQLGTPVIIRA
jgi:lipoprotein-anchoring transpeptidase ErfK/SrfK